MAIQHARSDQSRQCIATLTLQWAFQVGDLGQFETTPLVVDGVLYGTGQNDRAFALDARTGRAIWRYQRNLPDKLQPCCGMVNRGFAILGNRLFMATLDAHVIALDTKTGNVVWDVTAADYHQAYTFTVAPLAIKNEIIVGVSGGEYGVRGFVDAYDAETGRRRWRFNTVPEPGEPGHETWAGDSWKTGGAPAWITGSYDPELNLLFWPTGNPSPSNYGGERGGDNLYSNSMLALDPDTGKLRWYFQFTPHDVHDYDATQIPVLLDADWNGQPRKLLVLANRNGFLYVLDRTNGKFLSAKALWKSDLDAGHRRGWKAAAQIRKPEKSGRRARLPRRVGHDQLVFAIVQPANEIVLRSDVKRVRHFHQRAAEISRGPRFSGQRLRARSDRTPRGALKAIDPLTGEIKWEFPYFSNPNGGALTTAGGVVFAGDSDGNFIALDARTGHDLWHVQLGAAIYSTPITYAIDGKQYVAIPAGAALFSFSGAEP